MFRRKRRVPCKLNNVTIFRKHQTDASESRFRRTKSRFKYRVKSITGKEETLNK